MIEKYGCSFRCFGNSFSCQFDLFLKKKVVQDGKVFVGRWPVGFDIVFRNGVL